MCVQPEFVEFLQVSLSEVLVDYALQTGNLAKCMQVERDVSGAPLRVLTASAASAGVDLGHQRHSQVDLAEATGADGSNFDAAVFAGMDVDVEAAPELRAAKIPKAKSLSTTSARLPPPEAASAPKPGPTAESTAALKARVAELQARLEVYEGGLSDHITQRPLSPQGHGDGVSGVDAGARHRLRMLEITTITHI